MIGYIYVLWDKHESDIFYAGSSINPKIRLKAHIADNYCYDYDLEKKVIKCNININMSIIDEIVFNNREELYQLEIYWICQLHAWGFNLRNVHFYRNRKRHLSNKTRKRALISQKTE